MAEEVKADGSSFHKACFKCYQCGQVRQQRRQTDTVMAGRGENGVQYILTRVACLIECVHYDLERQCTNKEDGIIVTGEWN